MAVNIFTVKPPKVRKTNLPVYETISLLNGTNGNVNTFEATGETTTSHQSFHSHTTTWQQVLCKTSINKLLPAKDSHWTNDTASWYVTITFIALS
jgi:hypothetical protein